LIHITPGAAIRARRIVFVLLFQRSGADSDESQAKALQGENCKMTSSNSWWTSSWIVGISTCIVQPISSGFRPNDFFHGNQQPFRMKYCFIKDLRSKSICSLWELTQGGSYSRRQVKPWVDRFKRTDFSCQDHFHQGGGPLTRLSSSTMSLKTFRLYSVTCEYNSWWQAG
jgi:hypothetical protein